MPAEHLAIGSGESVIIFKHSEYPWPRKQFASAALAFPLGFSREDFDPKTALPLGSSPILSKHLTHPKASKQPVPASPRGEGSVLDSSGQSPRNNDAMSVKPAGAVTTAIRAFGDDSTHSPPSNPGSISDGADGKKVPTTCSTSHSLKAPTFHSSEMPTPPVDSSDQTSDSGSRSEVPVLTSKAELSGNFSPSSHLASLDKQTSIQTTYSGIDNNTKDNLIIPPLETSEIIVGQPVRTPSHLSQSTNPKKLSDPSTPPPSPLLMPHPSPPPSRPAKAGLDCPPSISVIIPEVVSDIKGDQSPNSEPRITLGLAAEESAAIDDPGQTTLTEDEPRQKAKPFVLPNHNRSTPNPSKQNQNPWDLFGSPNETKIYSALCCGLACGAIATLSVPAAPVLACVAGIATGAIIGHAIAEKFQRIRKEPSNNRATI